MFTMSQESRNNFIENDARSNSRGISSGKVEIARINEVYLNRSI